MLIQIPNLTIFIIICSKKTRPSKHPHEPVASTKQFFADNKLFAMAEVLA